MHVRPLHADMKEATGGVLTRLTVLLWGPVAPRLSVTVKVMVWCPSRCTVASPPDQTPPSRLRSSSKARDGADRHPKPEPVTVHVCPLHVGMNEARGRVADGDGLGVGRHLIAAVPDAQPDRISARGGEGVVQDRRTRTVVTFPNCHAKSRISPLASEEADAFSAHVSPVHVDVNVAIGKALTTVRLRSACLWQRHR